MEKIEGNFNIIFFPLNQRNDTFLNRRKLMNNEMYLTWS